MENKRYKQHITLGRFARSMIENFNQILSLVELKTQQRFSGDNSEVSPVFIVGLPRSGTTLLYQLLLNYFDWVYFPRSMRVCYRFPITAYKMQRLLLPEPKGFEYQSDYGVSAIHEFHAQPWRPIEGHQIWQRWFPEKLTHYYEGDLSPAAIDEMRSMIAGFIAVSGKPFLNKNPRHSVRLRSLSQAFPKALFIVLRRERLYVAQSLYRARILNPKPDPNDDWWGTRPREYMYLKDADPMRQAVGQTKAIEHELKTQLQSLPNRYVELDYQQMCRNPAQVLHDVQRVCLEHGISLRRTRPDDPMIFSLQDERKISEAEFDQLQHLLALRN